MAHIEVLAPSQQLELVEARKAGQSYRDLEKYCFDHFGVTISHETIRSYFEHSLETLPSNVRELKAAAILGLSDQMERLQKMVEDIDNHSDMTLKDRLAIMSERTKLLIGVAAIKPDMPMPTNNATPTETTMTTQTRQVKVVFAKEPGGQVVEGSVDD